MAFEKKKKQITCINLKKRMWTLGKSKPDNAGIFRGTQSM